MARPKKEIDYAVVEKLAMIHCTQEEIAAVIGCSVDTLQRSEEFCGIYKKGIDNGKASLRRMQWKSAEAGDKTMLVWLGKQYLNQRDNKEISISEMPKVEIIDNLPECE